MPSVVRSIPRLRMRGACLIACAGAPLATTPAQTPAFQVRVEVPGAAPVVRIRWPATSLSRADTARLVALDDAAGAPLSFGFVIAPEDRGRTVHPMWLIARLDGAAPYRLGVSRDGLRGHYREAADLLAGGRPSSFINLPVATVPADVWGPIVAVLEDAQAARRAADMRWRGGVLALAVAGLVALAALIAFFARAQVRRDDMSRL